eukprot:6650337-Prorocentrum_lima.AAC.1
MTAPTTDLQLMSDAAFSMTLRRRLLMSDADIVVTCAPTLCQNVVLSSGDRCGHALATDALHHFLTCRAGPGRNARHNRLRDFMAKWLQERMVGQ